MKVNMVNVRLQVPLLEWVPRRLVLALLGDSLLLKLRPEQFEGEVRVTSNRYFALGGEWDKCAEATAKKKTTHTIMEAALAGQGSELWLQQRDKLIAWVREKPLNRSNNWTLRTPADVDAYLDYCHELAHAVKESRLKDRDLPVGVAIGRGLRVYRTGDGRHRLSAALLTGTPLTGRVSHIHSDVLKKMPIACVLSTLKNTASNTAVK